MLANSSDSGKVIRAVEEYKIRIVTVGHYRDTESVRYFNIPQLIVLYQLVTDYVRDGGIIKETTKPNLTEGFYYDLQVAKKLREGKFEKDGALYDAINTPLAQWVFSNNPGELERIYQDYYHGPNFDSKLNQLRGAIDILDDQTNSPVVKTRQEFERLTKEAHKINYKILYMVYSRLEDNEGLTSRQEDQIGQLLERMDRFFNKRLKYLAEELAKENASRLDWQTEKIGAGRYVVKTSYEGREYVFEVNGQQVTAANHLAQEIMMLEGRKFD